MLSLSLTSLNGRCLNTPQCSPEEFLKYGIGVNEDPTNNMAKENNLRNKVRIGKNPNPYKFALEIESELRCSALRLEQVDGSVLATNRKSEKKAAVQGRADRT